MYFLALAADFDGTLAKDGQVEPGTWASLRRLKASGRKLLLVTGRTLEDIATLLPEQALFDLIVAENGALLHHPGGGPDRLLCQPPSVLLLQRLQSLGVQPLSVGRAIIATFEPHHQSILAALHELGLELQISFNKGAVMVLPSGVNKATGLAAALAELGLSSHNVVGVGDAENDHALLQACGCSAAVSNALPALKQAVDLRLQADHGAGVSELINLMLEKDASLASPRKHGIPIGLDAAGRPVLIEPYDGNLLITGGSCSGKSTLITRLTEELADRKFEFCIIDPEGDYIGLANAVCVGNRDNAPDVPQALEILRKTAINLVINTQALELSERQRSFALVLSEAKRHRLATGRPHWLIVDEAHEVFPAPGGYSSEGTPSGMILVTLCPHLLAPQILQRLTGVLALGHNASEFLASVAGLLGMSLPVAASPPDSGVGLYWCPRGMAAPVTLEIRLPSQLHRRHAGKYAVGDVGEGRSFYFHDRRRNSFLAAKNLFSFLDIAAHVDDEIWYCHLKAGDFSAWFRHVIKDEELAEETRGIELNPVLGTAESRRRIRQAICRRYAGITNQ